MKKIINFRPIFIASVLVSLGIIFSFLILKNLFWIIGASVLLIAVFVLFIVLKNVKRAIIFSLIFIFAIGISFLSLFTYTNSSINGKEFIITGRVTNIYQTSSGGCTAILHKVTATDAKNQYNLNGHTMLFCYNYGGNNSIEVGDKLAFSSILNCVEVLTNDEINTYYYKNNIKYITGKTTEDITIFKGNMMLTEAIRQQSRINLIENLGEVNGGIAYAVLFGDKTLIDNGIFDLFNINGISHILAVSGLHVSFLIALIYFVFKLFVKNKWANFFLVFACLFAYCYICNFSPSVVRATIMGLCLILGKASGKQYDSLTSLSLSAIIILLFKPLNIFDAGFQLSYAAVLGIIIFLRLFNKIPINNKFLKIMLGWIGVSLSAQIAMLPISIQYFKGLSTYSLIANPIIVPIFAIFYIVLCITNLLVLIIPFLNFLLIVPNAMISVIIYIANLISKLPYSFVKIFNIGAIATLIFYLTVYITSRFVMINKKVKAIICSVLGFLCAILIVLNNIPATHNDNKLCVIRDNSNIATIITTSNNQTYVLDLTEDYNCKEMTTKQLYNKRIFSVDYLIFTKDKTVSTKYILEFIEDFNIKNIVLPAEHISVENLKSRQLNVIEFSTTKTPIGNKIIAKLFQSSGNPLGVQLDVGNNKLIFTSFQNYSHLISLIDYQIDVFLIKDAENKYIENINISKFTYCYGKNLNFVL